MESPLIILILILVTLLAIAAFYPHRMKFVSYLKSYLLLILTKLQESLTLQSQAHAAEQTLDDIDNIYFQSLAPTDKADENGKYSAAIRWAIEQKSIRNIAITGSFGAGKTSVLKTFEKNSPDIEFLNISLGSFSENTKKERKNGVTDEEKRQRDYLIEKSILQQIIYKETKEKLPQSRFERLSRVSEWDRRISLSSSILFVLLLLIIIKIDIQTLVKAISFVSRFDFVYQFLIYAFLVTMMIALVIGVTRLITDTLKYKNLNKVNLLKGDIELSEKTGASILNLHIDEIIYFFEVTNYQIVIFEDLDRFDGVEIFTKLREINILLNQSKQLSGKKIVFIYAVKDDIFDEVSRTKFFEFIVPVIPIVNSSNSRDILIDRLNKTPYGKGISEEFVSVLTLYVDDMRLVLNIFNEYIIYSEKLMHQLDLIPQKLLAFIVYKNKYPSDFSLLNKGKGIVAEAFENKNTVILALSKEIDESIEQLENEISQTRDRINSEIAKNSRELRALYLFKYVEKTPNLENIQIENNNISLSNLLDESSFEKLMDGKNNIGTNNYGQRLKLPQFDAIQNEVDADYSYSDRLSLLEKNGNARLDNLYADMQGLKEKKANLRGRSLSFILENYPHKKADLLGQCAKDNLLSYLLINNWIDEGYYNYLSYFHPGSRTPQDVNFLLAVNESKKLPITYNIKTPDEILRQLGQRELSSQYSMNLELLDYMYSISSPRLDDFLTNFNKFTEDGFEFVMAFVNYSKHSGKFIEDLSGKWYSFASEALAKSGLSESKKSSLLKLVLQSSSVGTVLNQNRDSVISDYISSSKAAHTLLLEISTSKCKEVITKLKIKFTNIELFTSSPELYEFIVDNYYYSLNPQNIKSIFDFYGLSYEDEYPSFSNVQGVSNPDINGYISKKLNTYVSDVLFKLDGELEEDANSIKILLNSSELSTENKVKVIQKVSFALEEINDVKSAIVKLWPLLLSHKRLNISWQNLFEAYFQDDESIIDELWRYMSDDKVSAQLSTVSIPEVYQPDIQGFFEKLIQAKNTRPETLNKIIHEFPIKIDSLNNYELSSEVTSVLVNADKVSLTDQNIEVLRNYSIRDVETLIAKNIDEFIDETGHVYKISQAELEGVLKNDDLSQALKLQIISKYQDLFFGEPELLDSAWSIIKDARLTIILKDELVIELIKKLTTMSDKCLLLAKQMKGRDWENLSNLLNSTGIKPLLQIASRRRFIYLHNTIGEAKFADELLASGHISQYNYENDGDDEKIKINSKRR